MIKQIFGLKISHLETNFRAIFRGEVKCTQIIVTNQTNIQQVVRMDAVGEGWTVNPPAQIILPDDAVAFRVCLNGRGLGQRLGRVFIENTNGTSSIDLEGSIIEKPTNRLCERGKETIIEVIAALNGSTPMDRKNAIFAIAKQCGFGVTRADLDALGIPVGM